MLLSGCAADLLVKIQKILLPLALYWQNNCYGGMGGMGGGVCVCNMLNLDSSAFTNHFNH